LYTSFFSGTAIIHFNGKGIRQLFKNKTAGIYSKQRTYKQKKTKQKGSFFKIKVVIKGSSVFELFRTALFVSSIFTLSKRKLTSVVSLQFRGLSS